MVKIKYKNGYWQHEIKSNMFDDVLTSWKQGNKSHSIDEWNWLKFLWVFHRVIDVINVKYSFE